jgi:aspartate beta-hydroxylase
LRRELARARSMCDEYAAQFESFLRQRLIPKGLNSPESSERFRQSFDILLGKKQIYFQQPRSYYFPELPQVQFYDKRHFPWVPQVEAATAVIRAELLELLQESSLFRPYFESDPRRPGKDESGMQDNPDWSAFYLWRDGEEVPENAARCPKTLAALSGVPHTKVHGRSPSILFSMLRPGARIPPHTGLVNTRLICHLPLLVPPDCGLRVGNETRVPVEGKIWMFDDTMEHEAWNLSDRPRVILLFEVWRPELTNEERELVGTIFEAIDAHGGKQRDWGI